MTDKRKKRVRAIQAKTGIAYQSAVNQLNNQKEAAPQITEVVGKDYGGDHLLYPSFVKARIRARPVDLVSDYNRALETQKNPFWVDFWDKYYPEELDCELSLEIQQAFGEKPLRVQAYSQISTRALSSLWSDPRDSERDLKAAIKQGVTDKEPKFKRTKPVAGPNARGYNPETTRSLRDWKTNPAPSRYGVWAKDFLPEDIRACRLEMHAQSEYYRSRTNNFEALIGRCIVSLPNLDRNVLVAILGHLVFDENVPCLTYKSCEKSDINQINED